jgi:predicted signal transduction protein with EAL and GGDEF domain
MRRREDIAPGVLRPGDALAGRVGTSAGSACFPVDAHDPEGLLRVADARLYEDKRARRGAAHARVARTRQTPAHARVA